MHEKQQSTCEICGKPAIATCKICGRRVCMDHYDHEKEICTVCSKTLCEFCGERLAINTCSICGKLGCDQCLVQLDPSRWICKDCLQQISKTKHIEEILCRPSSYLARSLWG